MPSELTKTYVPSFDEFVEDPDKWLSQLDGYANPDAQGENPQAQAQVTNEDDNAAAPGDVQVGNAQPTIPGSEPGAQAGGGSGWDTPAGGAQPLGGQMAQDNAGSVGAQTPVQGAPEGVQAQGTQPGAQAAAAQPGAQAGTVPPAQPANQAAPAQPAPAQEEENKQPAAPAATGF